MKALGRLVTIISLALTLVTGSVALTVTAIAAGDGGGGGESGDDGDASSGASGGGGAASAKRNPDYTAARKHIEEGRYATAIPLPRKIVAADPINANAHNYLGYSYRKLKRLDATLDHYTRALTIKPDHRGANEYLGGLHLESGWLTLAEERLAKLADICSDCEQYHDLRQLVADYKAANYLKNVDFTFGETVKLGKSRPRDSTQGERRASTVIQRKGSVVFMVESIDWPHAERQVFHVNSNLYRGTNAIVRYDNGQATNFHVLFDSKAFASVVATYEGRLGPPTDRLERPVAAPGAAKRTNSILIWHSVDPGTGRITKLEVRNFDDARSGFPDTGHGVIMLHHERSLPIFPNLSSLDLMMLQ